MLSLTSHIRYLTNIAPLVWSIGSHDCFFSAPFLNSNFKTQFQYHKTRFEIDSLQSPFQKGKGMRVQRTDLVIEFCDIGIVF